MDTPLCLSLSLCPSNILMDIALPNPYLHPNRK